MPLMPHATLVLVGGEQPGRGPARRLRPAAAGATSLGPPRPAVAWTDAKERAEDLDNSHQTASVNVRGPVVSTPQPVEE
jgi:hypothetical protein